MASFSNSEEQQEDDPFRGLMEELSDRDLVLEELETKWQNTSLSIKHFSDNECARILSEFLQDTTQSVYRQCPSNQPTREELTNFFKIETNLYFRFVALREKQSVGRRIFKWDERGGIVDRNYPENKDVPLVVAKARTKSWPRLIEVQRSTHSNSTKKTQI